ncbi:MAG: ABC transporter ATP-binding protein [Streptosporangiaceae bacterium]
MTAASPAGSVDDGAGSPVGTAPILSVTGLTKRFGSRTAVTDVTFDLPAGGSLGIVGESGAGKTTVARMIAGLEVPTAGSIVCCGRDRSAPARKTAERRVRGREVQIVFQDPYSSLDRRQSAAASLDEILRLHDGGTSQQRAARVAELADLVGLDERQVRALPRAMSGGQRQRVAIARALAARPSVLILDESVSALDVSIQAQILNLLADIREQTGLSYLLISHDLAVVRQLAEQAIVMYDGRIVDQGPIAELLDNPQHDYTRLLRASVPAPGWKPSRRLRAS